MTKPGVKPGSIVRPKGPTTPAKDMALCTVKDGATAGTKWYVSEMGAKGGKLCKCWKVFPFEELPQESVDAMTDSDLGRSYGMIF